MRRLEETSQDIAYGLADAFTDALKADETRRSALADIAGSVAQRLAVEDERASGPVAPLLWTQLRTIADRLYHSDTQATGRLPFISQRFLELLIAECRLQLPDRSDTGNRSVAGAGRALASLAVSGKLTRAMEAALGGRLQPARRATYMYDPPGSLVATHLDNAPYEVVFHLILEHDPPTDGSASSALVAHLPDRDKPTVLALKPGEGVALSCRGTLHGWERLGPGERRTLIAIGFARESP